MEKEIIYERPMRIYKRQRFMSCPSVHDQLSSPTLISPVRRTHRQSQIEELTFSLSESGELKSSSSESDSSSFLASNEVGVRSFSSWKPRRNSTTMDIESSVVSRATFALHEDSVLDEMNIDRKRVIESKPSSIVYYNERVAKQNPFKSDLFVRVLYLIGSSALSTGSEQASNASINDQFLTDEQIRQNQLREQLGGVERLRHELKAADGGQSRSGTVTPAEFIYQSIPNIIKRNSYNNFKVDPDPPPNFLGESKTSSIKSVSSEDSIDSLLIKNRSSHKLSNMEKCMLAPLTF